MRALRKITPNPMKIKTSTDIPITDDIKETDSFSLYLKSRRFIRLHVNKGENWLSRKLMDSCQTIKSFIFSLRFINFSENFDDSQRIIKRNQVIMKKITKTNEDPAFLTNCLD